jgi:predicted nucleic acid-binding protein
MIVVDTNVVAYMVIDGPHTANVGVLRREDPDWRVPSLFVYEWQSVLTRYLSTSRMDRDTALRAYRRGLDLVRVEPIDAQATALRIFNLHLQSKLSSYDCEFVMLAELLGCKLASGDQAIAIAFPDLVRTI